MIKTVALCSALITLVLTLFASSEPNTNFSINELNFLGDQFSLGLDGISVIMLLLTNTLFPFILLSGFKQKQSQPSFLYAMLLLVQSFLIGVFLARSAFLFYIFWELALIPVYFILLLWGGEGKRSITLKFFIYTLAGSLLLLFGIIYLYQLTPGLHSTTFDAFNHLHLSYDDQVWLFWILFLAFAIKMPIFPFHTWQPATYTMAPPQGVMILAGIMTKMGIYGVLRFIFPIVPLGAAYWQNFVITISLIGMVYASIIAFRQNNLKRLIAFSSLAHISLMCAAMFAMNYYAMQGVLVQVVGHGVTIVVMFYLITLIEERSGSLEQSFMGGMKLKAPQLALMFLIVSLGSIALPLTTGFIGEFLMLNGLFSNSIWYAAVGGLAMILSAIYMLYAYQRAMLGELDARLLKIDDIKTIDYIIIIPLIVLIFGFGIFPEPIIDMVEVPIKNLQDIVTPIGGTISSIIK